MSSFNDHTVQSGTIPTSDEEQKFTSPSVTSQNNQAGYYGQEMNYSNSNVATAASASGGATGATYAYPVHIIDDQSSFTRANASTTGGGRAFGSYGEEVYDKEAGATSGAAGAVSGGYYMNKSSAARSIVLAILSILLILFLIIFGFLLIIPTGTLIKEWFVFQLDFTRLDFTQLFQQTSGNNTDVTGLQFSDSGISDLIRFGLFGYCTGSLNNFNDFVSTNCAKKNLWSVNLTDIISYQIQNEGSTEAKVLAAQYGLNFPNALNKIDSWQPKGTAICYIILLILSFFALGSMVWIVVVQATKGRTFKNGVFNFKAPLILVLTLSCVSLILYVIGAGAISNYAASTIVRGVKNQKDWGIIATRSVLFFLFSWIGFAVSLIVVMATALTLWLSLQSW
ncbi:hypothetical protein WICPIJ_005404 [Wickerhamomyces pijperi]|uniref:Uncharacterized protein n=1 Tax=Wickerhamomyces pijperi TaxID=599730 RepID=A0A9P8Q5T2_WICPI|nr:hypothetical protein WICPIJ_005404 [Wickerhamomyces pijperi]